MKVILASDRVDAAKKAPKAVIIRRAKNGQWECFFSRQEYAQNRIAKGLRVNKKWLPNVEYSGPQSE